MTSPVTHPIIDCYTGCASRPYPLLACSLRLRDGRRLGFAEYGDPAGRPVLSFHGLPGSRLQRHPDDALTAAAGVRLIAPDRPGFGLSDAKADRSLLDWHCDVLELADALGLARFAVAGVSAGAPYAAACAFAIPERLSAVGLVSGLAPFDARFSSDQLPWQFHTLLGLAAHSPWLLKAPLRLLGELAKRFPERRFDAMRHAMHDCDRAVLARPEVMAMFAEDISEALRGGEDVVLDELRLLAQPWGFALEQVRAPVYLWHGEQDATTPIAPAQAVARAIPGCRTRFIPDRGHFLVLDHWTEILTALVHNE